MLTSTSVFQSAAAPGRRNTNATPAASPLRYVLLYIIDDTVQTERPLSDKEIKILRQDLKRLDKQKLFQIKFLVGWTLLAIIVGTFVYFRLDTTTELYLLIGTVVIYILIGVWTFLEAYLKQKKLRKNINFVFATNKVKSIKVIGTDYIELSEVEDEGVNYLFQISDNKILSFGGQDFYPTKNFPSDNFEIAICNGQKGEVVLLETYNYGKKIRPNRKITA
ncbi:hypothetical protein [Siphonobacter sp. SORGH_AS_0500]|uniref:hypothetical protein n=1 Tax=Siphonobacter sp. SORGH_AS_0500 TaxID=1864824 RepID=UPI00285C7963|nr:hypothetical protein [Siphonobacter sp. SORGH_AS_0500]MDR6195697.1 succinate dehydrogenase hydrophobic anchor subunit [Siphonobacter sp. SORGH_AS_0500]